MGWGGGEKERRRKESGKGREGGGREIKMERHDGKVNVNYYEN